jgi:cytochrome c-type biogenesis protein CcmE
VNTRAKRRLIAVTVVILAAILTMVMLTATDQGAVYTSVAKVASDSSLVGKKVKVGGTVVAGSWDKKSNPMRFTIRSESDTAGTGPTLKVVYSGTVPSTFGDGVVAIVTGTLARGGVVNATEMITKCPSKYQSATNAMPVADLVGAGESLVGKPIQATGYVKPGSIAAASAANRFIVAEKADGSGASVAVTFSGALPKGMVDAVKVVIAGEVDQEGQFIATSVALAK